VRESPVHLLVPAPPRTLSTFTSDALGPSVPISPEALMPVWKVLFIVLLFCLCLGLASATVVVPMGESGGGRWLWLGGLLAATAVMGALFVLFLRRASTLMR
jgi:hypothetical protein